MFDSKVICVIPTRGLIYAKTIRGVLRNIREPIIVDGLPIPDCFNSAVVAALINKPDYIWFVEEDNEVPEGVLSAFLKTKSDIITMDYPVAKGISHIHKNSSGEIDWCGLGCTLIHRRVFEAIDQPWFEVNILYNQNGDEVIVPEHRLKTGWGGHDTRFFKKALNKGFKINVVEGFKGEHYRAEEIPKREMNNGFYTIKNIIN
jgi:hypothetical protein